MLVEVPYSYVYPYRRIAAKEHVSVSETKKTRWFRTEGHEGFGGLIEAGAGTLRVKGIFVHPEFRKRGFGTAIADGLIAEATSGPQKRLEVLAYNAAFYETRGFTRKSQLRNGAWRLVRE